MGDVLRQRRYGSQESDRLEEPPRWLVASVDRLQGRVDRLWRRLRGSPETVESREVSEEERLERAMEEEAAFERKWGIYYKPLAFLLVLWLIFIALWDRL
jgi:hypothetical protein